MIQFRVYREKTKNLIIIRFIYFIWIYIYNFFFVSLIFFFDDLKKEKKIITVINARSGLKGIVDGCW
jgi:hypothetical protein